MKKSFLKWNTCIAGMLLAFSLTSCVSESDETPEVPTGDGTLVININSTPVGATTRSTDLSSVTESTEKTVNNVVIGVFRPSTDATNANAKVEIMTLSSLSADLSTADLVKTMSVERASGSTALSLQAGDVVLAVCNVPADVVTNLEGEATADGFRQTAFSIDNALIFNDDGTAYANSGTAETPAQMPMYGEGTVTAHATISGGFTTTITVRHMVAKVTLNQVKLVTSDASQQFRITQVFLTHVTEKADFYYSDYSALTYGFNQTITNYYQGENNTIDNTDLKHGYRDYLSTEALTAELTNAAPTYDTKHILYTMPSGATTDADLTRLVVKGNWSDDSGANWSTDPVYYPIKLSNVTAIGAISDAKVQPNSHYIIDLVIMRKGSSSADEDITATNTATANVQHVDWTEQTVTSTFEAIGGDPTPTY